MADNATRGEGQKFLGWHLTCVFVIVIVFVFELVFVYVFVFVLFVL